MEVMQGDGRCGSTKARNEIKGIRNYTVGKVARSLNTLCMTDVRELGG